MRLLHKLRRRLNWEKLSPPTAREEQLIGNLRREIYALPTLVESQAASDAERAWLRNRQMLRAELLAKDPRGFVDFPVIQDTMFINDASWLLAELQTLEGETNFAGRWKPLLKAPSPFPFPRYCEMPSTNGLAVHHAYHLQQFEKATRTDISRFKRLFEFGGGFGHLCRLVHHLGFKGEYVIFDLPEFSALQKFYLEAHDIPAKAEGHASNVVRFHTDMAAACNLMRSAPPDVFIATWSFSEAPPWIRERMMPEIIAARHLLIAYQKRFEEIDNDQFFRGWAAAQTKFDCQFVQIKNLPGENYYMFATQKRSAGS